MRKMDERASSSTNSDEVRKNLVFLTKNLTNLPMLLIYLVQEGILSEDEKERISNQETELDKVYKLLSILQRKDWPNIRLMFLKILQKTNNNHCVQVFETKAVSEPPTANTISELVSIGKKSGETAASNYTSNDGGIYINETHLKNEVITKEKVLEYMKNVTRSKIISGIYIYYYDVQKGIEMINTIAGKSPGILTTEMPNHLDDGGNSCRAFVEEITSNWVKGHLINIQWWNTPLLSLKSFQPSDDFEDDSRKWKDLISGDGDLNKEWKKILDEIAPFLKMLETNGVVPIWNPLLYLNHKHSFWRGRRFCLQGSSKKLFQITRDYLTTHHNLHSLIWVWSLHNAGDMTNLEEYWPGNDYVDVVSVEMGDRKELNTWEYEKLLNVVENKPIGMECMLYVPTKELLVRQPQWTWFTAHLAWTDSLKDTPENVKGAFQSNVVVNKGNIDIFNK